MTAAVHAEPGMVAAASPPPLRVGVAGLGTVGGGVLRVLRDNADLIAARAGRPIVVTAVSARDRTRNRGVDLAAVAWHGDPLGLAADARTDVVVELIGGSGDPARGLVMASLAAGKPVVTANKALLARHGVALAEAAEAIRRGVWHTKRPWPAAFPSSRPCAKAWPATASAASPAS